MELFGVGIPEIGLIILIALVIVGPQRFPEVARQIARWIRTARAFTDEVMKDVRAAVDEIEQEVTASNDGFNPIRELADLRGDLNGAAQEATSSVSEATTLPALPEPEPADAATMASAAEWATVTETTDTGALPIEERAVEERRAGS